MRQAGDPAGARRPAVGLAAAALALVLAVAGLHRYQVRAQAFAAEYAAVLAPNNMTVKSQYLTLQRAALTDPHLLPIYGTSELYCCGAPFNPTTVFRNEPDGFAAFAVGYPLTTDLFFAETFAALGHELRGKKVVVSDSPWFFDPHPCCGSSPGVYAAGTPGVQGRWPLGTQGLVTPANYAHVFSPEVAVVATFDAPLPPGVRRGLARRMLAFPQTLRPLPLVRYALEDLAAGTPRGTAAYLLLDPLGRLDAWIAQIHGAQDTVLSLRGRKVTAAAAPAPALSALAGGLLRFARGDWQGCGPRCRLGYVPRRGAGARRGRPYGLGGWLGLWGRLGHGPPPPLLHVQHRALDWSAMLTKADTLAAQQSSNNPFGVTNASWKHCGDITPAVGPWCAQALALYRQGRSNQDGSVYPYPTLFADIVGSSPQWTDLQLELQVLRALGAKPFVYMMPLQGDLLNYTPISKPVRQLLYDRYSSALAAAGVPGTTFETREGERYFLNTFGHFSQRGWVFADLTIDLFWHNQLGLVANRLAVGGSVGPLLAGQVPCPADVGRC